MTYIDYRLSLTPETARHRLEFWLGIEAARDAAEFVDALRSQPKPRDAIDLAFDNVVRSNIRLAKAQLQSMEVSS